LFGEGLGRQGDHAARAVQFFGKGMHMEQRADGPAGGPGDQAEAALVAITKEECLALRGHGVQPSFCSMKSARLPTVANTAPSTSSSPIEMPKVSSMPVSTAATAIESSSGRAPSRGVSRVKDALRPLRLSVSSSRAVT